VSKFSSNPISIFTGKPKVEGADDLMMPGSAKADASVEDRFAAASKP